MGSKGVGKRSLLVASTLALLLVLAGGTNASPVQQELLVPDSQASMFAQDGSWTSGWFDIAPDQELRLTHNLGGNPDAYAVDLWYRDTDPVGLGINHRAYGGMEVEGQFSGADWQRLTDSTIEIYRFANDLFADQILVRLWVPDPPLWDSGWLDIAPGQPLTLTHNVGGDPDEYTVGIKFKDTGAQDLGVHLRYAGGIDIQDAKQGAAWQNLTDTTIQVVRFPQDTSTGQVRVQIFDPEPPAYDSGWQGMIPGQSVRLSHNLGGNPLSYVVRVSARDTRPGGRGINTFYLGGIEIQQLFFGSNWDKLTASSIDVFRQPDDSRTHTTDQARVRIWRREYTVYLPVVIRSASLAAQ